MRQPHWHTVSKRPMKKKKSPAKKKVPRWYAGTLDEWELVPESVKIAQKKLAWKEASRKYRATQKGGEKVKAYTANNAERASVRSKAWYIANREYARIKKKTVPQGPRRDRIDKKEIR